MAKSLSLQFTTWIINLQSLLQNYKSTRFFTNFAYFFFTLQNRERKNWNKKIKLPSTCNAKTQMTRSLCRASKDENAERKYKVMLSNFPQLSRKSTWHWYKQRGKFVDFPRGTFSHNDVSFFLIFLDADDNLDGSWECPWGIWRST